MDIRLIAFDLDWTILNSKKEISPRTRLALESAARAGKMIVPATGRRIAGIPDYLLNHPGVRYVITDNGTQVVAMPQRKMIYSRVFQSDTTRSLLAVCREFKALTFISTDGVGIIDQRMLGVDDEGLQSLIEYFRAFGNQNAGDLEKVINTPGTEVNKYVLVFSDQDEETRAVKRLEKRTDICLSSSDKGNLEIMPPDTSKGIALQFLAEHLGFDMQSVMAIGDNFNDIDMISAAGYGVAMENAIDELKEVADDVTLSCDDDGVAVAIERIL